MGANIVRDIFASITDIFGGRSGAYEEKLAQARRVALQEMADQATHLGANAVIGIDIDYEVVREGMLMVTASGTAVRIDSPSGQCCVASEIIRDLRFQHGAWPVDGHTRDSPSRKLPTFIPREGRCR